MLSIKLIITTINWKLGVLDLIEEDSQLGFYFPILSWLRLLRIYIVACLRLKVMACLSFKLDMRLWIDSEFDEITVTKVTLETWFC